ncbi:hypothetical protein ACE10X_13285 [Bradyrhizobium sp. Pha-3]|uniref:hypothetical protein n=1 Tax=Bradyrhizobium sp. Pha-3 TaxID=208375 RepID=UPI0035D4BF3D
MKVSDLVRRLHALPDQNATVVIGEGTKPDTWLIVSGVVPRQISRVSRDHAEPGIEAAVEIV